MSQACSKAGKDWPKPMRPRYASDMEVTLGFSATGLKWTGFNTLFSTASFSPVTTRRTLKETISGDQKPSKSS